MLHLNGNANTITNVKSDIEEKKKCDTPVVALACASGSHKNKPKKMAHGLIWYQLRSGAIIKTTML